MNRTRQLTIWAAVICACLAVAPAALAKQHPPKQGNQHARLDPHFGSHGVEKVSTPEAARPVKMAVGPEGKSYVLQGSLLLAFQSNGKPAKGFGNDGRVTIAPDKGAGEATGITVDSQGRILLTGSTYLGGQDAPLASVPADESPIVGLNEGFVIRLLPDGSRDARFGTGGEVDTAFGLPRPGARPGNGVEFQTPVVHAESILVDSQDRPVVAGSYVTNIYGCPGDPAVATAAFTARLTAAGAPDPSFGGKGYVPGAGGRPLGFAATPTGGSAMLAASAPLCTAKPYREPTVLDALGQNGEPAPGLDPARPSFYSKPMLAVDGKGRDLVVQERAQISEGAEPGTLVRLLPDGTVDTSFGHAGGFPLAGRLDSVGAIAVDSKGRPLVAGGEAGVELLRLRSNGKVDPRFGPKGVVRGGAGGNTSGEVGAVAVDAKGRIYVAGWVQSKALKAGHGVQVTRFLPGS